MASSITPKKFPIPVQIQSIDLSTLDFNQKTAVSNLRHQQITFVEPSTSYLFLGCKSGTVYVFSREAVKFLFLIPFKGGRVSTVSCSPDESTVAVGSTRGNVSIYRISPNGHENVNSHVTMSNLDLYCTLHTLSHHNGFSIRELHWSSQGKYLYAGDTSGMITQTDVASLDEFPRPIPTKTILKLKSPVIQIETRFPYLAISTQNGFFLCDLEKEDFTRVKSNDNKEIRAQGFCFVSKLCEEESGKRVLRLLILPQDTNTILHCSMEGFIVNSERLELSLVNADNNNHQTNGASSLFDPRNEVVARKNTTNSRPKQGHTSIGKLFCSDDGDTLISVSEDSIILFDMEKLTSQLRLNQFGEIKKFKLISNYGFLWHDSQVDVFALTQFWDYGQQLYSGNLFSVLDRWITHMLTCIGWDPTLEYGMNRDEESYKTAANNFRAFINNCDEENPFFPYLISKVPSDWIQLVNECDDSNDVECFLKTSKLIETSVTSLLADVSTVLSLNILDLKAFHHVFKLLNSFYSSFGCELSCNEKNEATLMETLASLHSFVVQSSIDSLHDDIMKSLNEWQKVKVSLVTLFSKIVKDSTHVVVNDSSSFFTDDELYHSEFQCLSTFLQNHHARCNDWFNLIGISSDIVYCDALLADLAILFVPIVGESVILNCLGNLASVEYNQLFLSMFFTWLVTHSIFSERNNSPPFATLLRTLRQEKLFPQVNHEIVSTMYRDILKTNVLPVSQTLHHFISAVQLFSFSTKEDEFELNFDALQLLISCCPAVLSRQEVVTKIVTLVEKNHILFTMFKMAIEKSHSNGKQCVPLCSCGLQKLITNRITVNGVPDGENPMKISIAEGVFRAMLNSWDELQSPNGVKTTFQVFSYASENRLVPVIFEDHLLLKQLDCDDLQIEVVVRSGSCFLLNRIEFTPDKCSMLVNRLVNFVNDLNTTTFSGSGRMSCTLCDCQDLEVEKSFQPLSWDCVGLWILNGMRDWAQGLEIITSLKVLNTPGTFSLRFYTAISKGLFKSRDLHDTRRGFYCSLHNTSSTPIPF